MAPAGRPVPESADVLRLWSRLREPAAVCGARMHLHYPNSEIPSARLVAFLGEKYLDARSAESLWAWAFDGRIVYFPLGPPRLDENLTPLSWPHPREIRRGKAGSLRWAPVGTGAFCVPETPTGLCSPEDCLRLCETGLEILESLP